MTHPASWPSTVAGSDLARFRAARQRAVAWLENHIADDGTPAGWELGNGWWRGPWSLALAGAPDVAAAMLGWIERNALTDDGDLRDGPYGGATPGSPVYLLSAVAIGAWLLARYDTANVINDCLDHFRDPASGGAYEHRDFHADPQQDILKTGQLGISALTCGRRDQADGVHRWLRRQYDAQPELPTRLYSSWRGNALYTDIPEARRWFYVANYDQPRQTYFNPGIAAAFLAGYAQIGEKDALDLAKRYLQFNITGTPAQFDDEAAIQICKFGWGAAMVHATDPSAGMLPWTARMGEWFVRRQRADGSWAPSTFLRPEPTLVDMFQKTSEHLMELTYIETALRLSPHHQAAVHVQ
jgi:hypothetical protein